MKKPHIVGISIIVLVVIAIIVVIFFGKHPQGSDSSAFVEKDGMTTFTESDFNFSVQYPSNWVLKDLLTPDVCCVFIAHIDSATSTVTNASGTPVEQITQTELIKLQIGPYDKRTQNPFSTSTREITLNGKRIYTGYMSTGEYFLIPRDENTGIGVAEFRYKETPQADIDTAQKIIGSLTLLGQPKK